MKNTYYIVPNDVLKILQETELFLSPISERPEIDRFIYRVKSTLKTLNEVKETNKNEYSTEDILQYFESFNDFENTLTKNNLSFIITYRNAYFCEVLLGGKQIHLEVNLGARVSCRNFGYCFCLKYLFDNNLIPKTPI